MISPVIATTMQWSSQIVRMLNELGSIGEVGGRGGIDAIAAAAAVDLCPPDLEKEIDAMNDFVYEKASAVDDQKKISH